VPQHLLFITGSLAAPALRRVLDGLGDADFDWEVRDLGVKVAALMTAETIGRRLDGTGPADRVVIPGRCRGDLDALAARFGVPFERGPEELRDLPRWLGRSGRPPDLANSDVLIFAELVDAPELTPEQILAQAGAYRRDGADVIDIGCLPGKPFAHLGDTVRLLKEEGFQVSVDSLDSDDLLTGGRAGADYLLSLTSDTLWIADEVPATPVLIPRRHGDLDSLQHAWETLHRRGRDALADPILDPVHFGFTASLLRYQALRQRLPEARLMMGIGNLTELTEADTCGMQALLFGIASELRIAAVLTTQVSPHCRSVVREADLARRIMYRAREDGSLPKHLDAGLTGLHECAPFPYDSDEIRAAADRVRDRNYRIQVNEDGIHVYNRALYHVGDDPFAIYPQLDVDDDNGHAFYLGVELARAEIALELGKRYTQDKPLQWGAAAPPRATDLSAFDRPAATRRKRR
jgi:dihydropteroate synthase-like protein